MQNRRVHEGQLPTNQRIKEGQPKYNRRQPQQKNTAVAVVANIRKTRQLKQTPTTRGKHQERRKIAYGNTITSAVGTNVRKTLVPNVRKTDGKTKNADDGWQTSSEHRGKIPWENCRHGCRHQHRQLPPTSETDNSIHETPTTGGKNRRKATTKRTYVEEEPVETLRLRRRVCRQELAASFGEVQKNVTGLEEVKGLAERGRRQKRVVFCEYAGGVGRTSETENVGVATKSPR